MVALNDILSRREDIPWWLLLPQGASKAIKRGAGYEPFRERARHGPIPLGGAVLTGPGAIGCKAVIHVAGINLLWFATEKSIRASVRSAMRIVNEDGFKSVAFPIIGSGSGSFSRREALGGMIDELRHIEFEATVIIVEYEKPRQAPRG